MKKFILFIAIGAVIAVIVTACNTNSSAVKAVSYEDTAGLSQFQAYKAMREQMLFEQAMANANPEPVQTTRTVYVRPKAEKVVMNSSSTHEAKVEDKKKGWSKAAKYATIGGGSGAVLGAVINKKDRVKGGVVGAVVLGGLGYVLGRAEDRKDGRVTK